VAEEEIVTGARWSCVGRGRHWHAEWLRERVIVRLAQHAAPLQGNDACASRVGFGGAVDGFDEGKAAAGFGAVADGGVAVLDGVEEVFEDKLVAADVADGGGGGALVCGGGDWPV